jgi:hypothetical protein
MLTCHAQSAFAFPPQNVYRFPSLTGFLCGPLCVIYLRGAARMLTAMGKQVSAALSSADLFTVAVSDITNRPSVRPPFSLPATSVCPNAGD